MWYYNKVSIVLIIIPLAGHTKNATLYAKKMGVVHAPISFL